VRELIGEFATSAVSHQPPQRTREIIGMTSTFEREYATLVAAPQVAP